MPSCTAHAAQTHLSYFSSRSNSCKSSKSKTHSHKKTCQSALEAIPAPESSISHDLTATLNAEEEDEVVGETGDMAEAERQLTLESGGMLTAAAATFCCGGPDSVQRGNKEHEHTDKSEERSDLERQLLGNQEFYLTLKFNFMY